MRKQALPLLLLLAACRAAAPVDPSLPAWSKIQLESLRRAVDGAAADALPRLDTSELDRALDDGDENAIRRTATALAGRLARAHLQGCAPPAERIDWHVDDSQDTASLAGRVQQAIASNEKLEGFFEGLNPAHPDYAALRAAYGAETDPARRSQLARNLERWRWMPRSLGNDYVLVNTAGFEVNLWRGGARAKTWPAVVGKTSTPTPAFNASITGVIFNPWWEVPPSIASEGGFSDRRGYVRTNGRIRQRPGPGNALGQMKLIMPNTYNIYLHDTPSKGYFTHVSRAYSHGCVRVGDALDFASTLLAGVRSRNQVNALVGLNRKPERISRLLRTADATDGKDSDPIKTTTVFLPASLPVYIAYFTVGRRGDGTLAFERDVYGRDNAIADPSNPNRPCSF